jgi:hypothetical protein
VTRPRGWTDDDLRRAVVDARSLREVIANLGLRPTDGAHRDVHRHARRLGITLPLDKQGHRSWTDDQLREAAATCATLWDVAEALGLAQSGQENEVLRRHAARLGITLPNGWPPSRRYLESYR